MNLINYLKINWKSVALAIVFLFLMFIIFRGCNNGPSTKDDSRTVDSLIGIIEVNVQAHKNWVSNVDKVIDSLKKSRDVAVRDAEEAKKEIRRITAKGKKIIEKEPLAFAPETSAACDSLAREFLLLSVINESYIQLTDSITNYYQSELDLKDSIATLQAKLIVDIRTSNAILGDKFEKMEKNYLKAERKRKGNQALNRVLSGAVLVLGGIVLLK